MPMKPASIEQVAPMRNPKAVAPPVPQSMMTPLEIRIRRKMTTAMALIVLIWRER
jgi:hypothetical protein